MQTNSNTSFFYYLLTSLFVALATLFSSGCDGDSDDSDFSGPSGQGNGAILIANETLEFFNAAINGTGFILQPIELTNVNTSTSLSTNGMGTVTTNLVNSSTTNAINNVVANTFSSSIEVGRRGSEAVNVPAGSYNVTITQVVRDPRETGSSFSGTASVGEGQTVTFTISAADENGITVNQE